jgi:hypothetical protein
MVATMQIHEMSATMTGTDKTASTVRFKLADDATIDAVDPITIPTGLSIERNSYHKKLRMFCETAPGTQVDNLQMYSDGANGFGTGVSVNASNRGVTWAANATALLTDGADLFGFTAGAPMNIDAVDTALLDATGYGGDIIGLQMLVASTAGPGELTDETITFSYDEI